MSHQVHIAFGLIALVLGLVLGLVGQQWLGPDDVHPIATGLIAVGFVATVVGAAERVKPQAVRSIRD